MRDCCLWWGRRLLIVFGFRRACFLSRRDRFARGDLRVGGGLCGFCRRRRRRGSRRRGRGGIPWCKNRVDKSGEVSRSSLEHSKTDGAVVELAMGELSVRAGEYSAESKHGYHAVDSPPWSSKRLVDFGNATVPRDVTLISPFDERHHDRLRPQMELSPCLKTWVGLKQACPILIGWCMTAKLSHGQGD